MRGRPAPGRCSRWPWLVHRRHRLDRPGRANCAAGATGAGWLNSRSSRPGGWISAGVARWLDRGTDLVGGPDAPSPVRVGWLDRVPGGWSASVVGGAGRRSLRLLLSRSCDVGNEQQQRAQLYREAASTPFLSRYGARNPAPTAIVSAGASAFGRPAQREPDERVESQRAFAQILLRRGDLPHGFAGRKPRLASAESASAAAPPAGAVATDPAGRSGRRPTDP